MRVAKDKNWAWLTKNSINSKIKTKQGIFEAFISGGGYASVYIDEKVTHTYKLGEYEILETKDTKRR